MNRRSKIYARVYILILIILTSCAHQKAVQFFVSSDGNDSNPGTKTAFSK
jgi:hypothetical protein